MKQEEKFKKNSPENFIIEFYNWFKNQNEERTKNNNEEIGIKHNKKAQGLLWNFITVFNYINKIISNTPYLTEFQFYMNYIKIEIELLYSSHLMKIKRYEQYDYLGQKETSLFSYLYSCIEKIIFAEEWYKKWPELKKDYLKLNQEIDNLNEEEKKNERQNFYLKFFLNPKKFGKLKKLKELQKSILWGEINYKKDLYMKGVLEFRNIITHRTIYSDSILNIGGINKNIDKYIQNLTLRFWELNMYLVYLFFYFVIQTKYTIENNPWKQ